MKNMIISIAVIICMVLTINSEARIPKEKKCLEMQGIVKQTGIDEFFNSTPLDSVLITINDLTQNLNDSFFASNTGQCVFRLAIDHQFTINFWKKGFNKKTICVDTRIPSCKTTRFIFPFDVDLFRKIDEVNISSLLKQPIAQVNFSPNKKEFVYNYNYTDLINARIRKMYAEYFSNLNDLPKYDSAVAINNGVESANTIVSENLESSSSSINANIVYKVQIVKVVFGPLPDNAPFFAKCGKADEFYSDGTYKYYIGAFETQGAALQQLDVLKKNGYADAFIVAFKGGTPIRLEGVVGLSQK